LLYLSVTVYHYAETPVHAAYTSYILYICL